MHQKLRVINARKQALKFLETHDVEEYACCGMPLDAATGQCQHRSEHPTPAYENMPGYPELYDDLGRYNRPAQRVDASAEWN